ncbi:hypothetical protein BDV59DRAFT_207950 [Aspergillus ambiguus]|uniref:uncharacterized protein n=1 Tax=Aspergillus ambiguus TaxID=176160 RepID=UPI003CCD384B
MLVRQYCFPLWTAVKYYCSRPFSIVLHLLVRRSPNSSIHTEKSVEFSFTPAINASAPTCNCNAHTTPRQQQYGLESVGKGASGEVYKVDEDIVLKSSQIFAPPSEASSTWAKWSYASETIFHTNLTNDERTVLEILQRHRYPHPYIAEAIDTHYPEGIYFRKYKQLSEVTVPSQPGRVQWYMNILTALSHLHDIGIAHSDVRIANLLFDTMGRYAYLCDFSTCSPFGKPNLAYPYPDFHLPTHIVSSLASDKTDRFIMGSLIYQLEHGVKPRLMADRNGSLIVPEIRTGSDVLDAVIQKAWLGRYISTSQMLNDVKSITSDMDAEVTGANPHMRSTESLRKSIRQWRGAREKQFGCVLHGVPSEHHLQYLADQHGWDKDADSRFVGCKF